MADREFDRHVKRTAQRPVTSGAVSVKEALLLGAALALCAFALALSTNAPTILLCFPALLIAVLYPYAKRVLSMPQAVLGVAFSFGIPMAYAAVLGGTAWSLQALRDAVPWQAWGLMAANLFEDGPASSVLGMDPGGDIYLLQHFRHAHFAAGPFMAAIRQAAIMTNDESKRVVFRFQDGGLTLTAGAANSGKSSVRLALAVRHPVDISFDPKFVLDWLKTQDREAAITMEAKTGKDPAVFRSGAGCLYVVVPMMEG